MITIDLVANFDPLRQLFVDVAEWHQRDYEPTDEGSSLAGDDRATDPYQVSPRRHA